MALTPGTRLGGYEVLALLGSSGMGDVYRARTRRNAREVTLIVSRVSDVDAERFAHFEQQVRAATALNHSHILAVSDVGQQDGSPYVVSELVDGDVLRSRLDGPVQLRRVLSYARQIARGLAAAHEAAIVHGSLTPDAVFITNKGRAKLRGFGFAALSNPSVESRATGPASVAAPTIGLVGEVAYMAPEQVQGLAADARSDVFSFGALLYHMLSGRPAFQGRTPMEIAGNILSAMPAPLAPDALPPGIESLVRRCLEKEPAARFQSAVDLSAALESLRGGPRREPEDTTATEARPHRHHSSHRLAPSTAIIGAVFAVLAGIFLGRIFGPGRSLVTEPPIFQRLTFERGAIGSARFVDDSNVVYSAAWDGSEVRVYKTRAGALASTRLDLPPAHLFSVSRSGDLAISLGHSLTGWLGSGTLARVPMTGGSVRQLGENVREAEWTPKSAAMAIVRRVNGRDQLEWPVGKVLYATSGFITTPRFSPDGDLLAFGDHSTYGNDDGEIAVIDAKGARRGLASNVTGIRGIAWSPSGEEVWFSAAVDDKHSFSALQAVTLTGQRRTIFAAPVAMALMDVTRNGKVLLSSETQLRHIETLGQADTAVRDLSVFDASVARAISDGGAQLLITRQDPASVYTRGVDQQAATRLGDGVGFDLTPDGKWALSVILASPSRVQLLPTGSGEPQILSNADELTVNTARVLPRGDRVVYLGAKSGEPWRAFVQNVNGGTPRAFTGFGVSALPSGMIVVTNDGDRVALTDPQGQIRLFSLNGGPPQPIPGMTTGEYPLAWSADGRSVFVTQSTSSPWRIERLDLATGQRSMWKEIVPTLNAGVRVSQIAMSPDGASFVHSYSQVLSNLYVVDGLQ